MARKRSVLIVRNAQKGTSLKFCRFLWHSIGSDYLQQRVPSAEEGYGPHGHERVTSGDIE
jgi:hypothetical protein